MRHPAILALGLLGTAAGCDLFNNALEVQNPGNIPASELEKPEDALLLANGAIADFECAAGAYAVMGGLITDERRRMTSSDARYAVNTCVGLGVYTPLQTARFSALNVLSLLQRWTDAQVPGRDTLIATLQAYEGYSLVLLGEGFCTMVVSTLDANRQTVYGGEIQRDSVLKLAIAAFSDAITGATVTGQADVLNMALVGRARAYADMNQLTLAKADAQQVAPGYVKSVTGYHLYQQLKYLLPSSPIRLASWDEARLIIAEADWAAADYASADSIINIFRTRGGQGAIINAKADTVKKALFEQRRREFFLEGQHLGDVIRFGFLPSPPAGTSFKGGGTYGTQLCLPLPDVEKNNNPNL